MAMPADQGLQTVMLEGLRVSVSGLGLRIFGASSRADGVYYNGLNNGLNNYQYHFGFLLISIL